MAASSHRRRWLQFSLRTLLIVVTLTVGGLVAWRVYVEPYRQQRETMKLVEELGGRYETKPGGPRWMREWFGAENLQDITRVYLGNTAATDTDIVYLKDLARLQGVYLFNTRLSDVGLGHLKGLTDLLILNLNDTQVSDAGLVHLRSSTKLCLLQLSGTAATDAGIEDLQKALPDCDIFPLADGRP